MEDKQPQTKTRIHQLDYLKGIFILLMVIFHLALVEETYPMLRNAVYTFHMSAFLIISGYLANVDKNPGKFGHDMMRLAVPYVIFESAIVYEYAFDKKVDKVVCVYLDKEERMRRLELRDHTTRAQLEARMANQLSAEEKMMRADYVILNYEGNPRARQVQHVHTSLLRLV